ncbi:MAG: hypothetical protein ACXVCO_15360, partial [Ktedonobacterales bacterium]
VVEVALVLHGVILRRAWGTWSREERMENVVLLVILGAGLAMLAGYLSSQAKSHYIVAFLPLLALYAWEILTTIYMRIPRLWLRVVYTAALVLLILIGMPSTYLIHYLSLYSPSSVNGSDGAQGGCTCPGGQKPHTRPGDSIWVYYNAPEIYWMANRKPATDEPEGTWLEDYYDQFWFQHTLLQLQQERPTVIIGFDNPRYLRARAAKVLDLPLVGSYIQSHYTCSRATPAEVGGRPGSSSVLCDRAQNPENRSYTRRLGWVCARTYTICSAFCRIFAEPHHPGLNGWTRRSISLTCTSETGLLPFSRQVK